MDRLRTMQSFVRVMHSGSFTIAARQLGISRALVSRHIIDLERHLGIRLLNRSTRNAMPKERKAALRNTRALFDSNCPSTLTE